METESISTEKSQSCIESRNDGEEKEGEGLESTEFNKKRNIDDIRCFLGSFSQQKNKIEIVSEKVKESVLFLNGLKRTENCCLEVKNEKQEFKKKY